MDNLTCNMCGSPDVKREGNYYVCNSCGTKRMLNEDNESLNENKELTESQKAELERLIANLEKDHSLADRILESDPKNCLAFYYKYVAGKGNRSSFLDEWLELLGKSGMSQKEIEDMLIIGYDWYHKRCIYDLNWKLNRIYLYNDRDRYRLYDDKKNEKYGLYYLKESDSLDYYVVKLEETYKLPNFSYFPADIKKELDEKIKKDLDSYCLHILSILGDDYSALTKSWQDVWDKANADIEEFKKAVAEGRIESMAKRNREMKDKNRKTAGNIVIIIGILVGLILGIVLYANSGEAISLIGSVILVAGISIGIGIAIRNGDFDV